MSAITLRTKVIGLAILNAGSLIAVLVWFARTQLTQDLGALLIGESRGRITAVAKQLGADLPTTPLSQRNELLERYSAIHGVQFYLFHNNGTQVGGPAVSLPGHIVEYLKIQRAKAPAAERLEGLVPEERPLLKKPELDSLLLVVDDPPYFVQSDSGYWLVMRMPLRSPDTPGFQPGMLILASPHFLGTPFFFNLRPWLGMTALVLVIAVVCWLPLMRGVTRSITALASQTAQIAKGKFDTKVNIKRSDELGDLGVSFNRMAMQLDGYVHGQKRFLRDAAHELRSPLARMQAAMGNLGEVEVSAEAEEYLEAVREEVEVMSSLTSDLLTFAREENSQDQLKTMSVNLLETVNEVLATESPDSSANIRVEIDADLYVIAHEKSLFRGLSNLVRNAIRYASAAGPITISAERQGQSTTITIADCGPGIPEESLELIFTPFYRLDDSRQRENGGNGLGMSIARACIEACKGTVYCRNGNPGLESIVTLRSGTS